MAYTNEKKSLTALRLREEREKRKLSYAKLEEALNNKYKNRENPDKPFISITSLKDYEVAEVNNPNKKFKKGFGMKVEYLKAFADFYGVSTDYLLGEIDRTTLDNEDIYNKTGLSDLAIERLKNAQSQIKCNVPDYHLELKLSALNFLIDKMNSSEFLDNLCKYLFASLTVVADTKPDEKIHVSLDPKKDTFNEHFPPEKFSSLLAVSALYKNYKNTFPMYANEISEIFLSKATYDIRQLKDLFNEGGKK